MDTIKLIIGISIPCTVLILALSCNSIERWARKVRKIKFQWLTFIKN